MLDRLSPAAEEMAKAWIGAFGAAVQAASAPALSELFVSDCHWRNIFGLAWQFSTVSGAEKLAAELLARAAEAGAGEFRIDEAALTPRKALVAGREVIEAVFCFATSNGPGTGALRLLASPDGLAKAWFISTTLDFDKICEARASRAAAASHARDFAAPDWREQRRASASYSDREPDVLIVGGGHAGISAAVELKRIGREALVIDKEDRVGDNWRHRYRGLKLHNKTPVNHLRYLPFPVTFPEYIPKDQIADFLESYAGIMEVDFWTRTTFEGADYDEQAQRWTARLKRAGENRVLRPKHIVLATSVSGTPNIPKIDGIENFAGKVLHSSQFAAGRGMDRPLRGRVRHRHQRPRHLPGAARLRRRRHHGAAQPHHGRQRRARATLRQDLSRRRSAHRGSRHPELGGAAAGDEGGA